MSPRHKGNQKIIIKSIKPTPDYLMPCVTLCFAWKNTIEQLKERLITILNKHKLDYKIIWRCSGQVFLTSAGELVEATQTSIKNVIEDETQLSTASGTSDGHFIGSTVAQVVEIVH